MAFAYELSKDLDVPVGILLSAHSNTRIEAFTERTAIERHESLQSDVKLIHDADPLLPAGQSSFKKYYSDLRAWQKAATAAIDSESRLPARPGLPGIAGSEDRHSSSTARLIQLFPMQFGGQFGVRVQVIQVTVESMHHAWRLW